MPVKVNLYLDSFLCFSLLLNVFIEGRTSCIIEDVLVFITGSDRVPPLGFDLKITVTFAHSGRFCTSSTCDLQFCIPVCYGENYQKFEEAMVMALKDNDGFGGL